MLKIFRGLFLGLVVLVGSACVTPTRVSSASPSGVLLTYIQASGPAGARDEAVVLFNSSSEEVNVTNWCLTNKSNVEFACISSKQPGKQVFLPAESHLVFISTEYTSKTNDIPEDAIYFQPSHATSGSITGSADTIRLINKEKDIASMSSWTVPLVSGKALLRVEVSEDPLEYQALGDASDWFVASALPKLPESIYIERTDDAGEEGNDTVVHPIITELLPNPEGNDTNNEFIELYNPSQATLYLSQYGFRVGDKNFSFPADAFLLPGEYKAFFNNDIKFTLPNSSGFVQLLYASEPVGGSIEYVKPLSGMSWSLVGAVWKYTNKPTPGSQNQEIDIEDFDEATTVQTQAKPCGPNQYRHPETRRCRSIPIRSTPAPCKPGQQRNAETGRCRTIATANTLTACKEGQVRNPETNRCKAIVKMTNAPHGITAIQQESSRGIAWYAWVGIAAVIVAVLGYGVWEWRRELLQLWVRIRKGIGRKRT